MTPRGAACAAAVALALSTAGVAAAEPASAADKSAGAAATKAQPKSKKRPPIRKYAGSTRRGIGPDLQLEIGFAFGLDDPPLSRRFPVRARYGVLLVSEPWFLAIGAILEGSGASLFAGGLQVELTHLWTGFWGQTGVSMGEHANTFIHIAAGWSLAGFEWQRQVANGSDQAFVIKLRLPFGFLAFDWFGFGTGY